MGIAVDLVDALKVTWSRLERETKVIEDNHIVCFVFAGVCIYTDK